MICKLFIVRSITYQKIYIQLLKTINDFSSCKFNWKFEIFFCAYNNKKKQHYHNKKTPKEKLHYTQNLCVRNEIEIFFNLCKPGCLYRQTTIAGRTTTSPSIAENEHGAIQIYLIYYPWVCI